MRRKDRPAVARQDRGPVREPDPTGPFADLGLPGPVVSRLARDGITEPFPIQAATIPDALAGRDVLGRGQTGSGKTLAFGLPMLARLADSHRASPSRPRALVLVPTRELALQVSDALSPIADVLGLRLKLIAGGLAYSGQIAALQRGVEVLVATPGRLIDLIGQGEAALDDVSIAVLDEADQMADLGFLPEVSEILDLVPPGGQRMLFSATLDRGVDEVVERYLAEPVVHATDAGTASVTTMEHHVLLVQPQHKKLITAQVTHRQGRTIAFVRTKLAADRVAEELRAQGVHALALHGGLQQGARNRVLAAFRDGQVPVLVATDVAARGIHVDDVSLVLHVDPPLDHKAYVHRAGRTARAGESGAVVALALPHQRRQMARIWEAVGVDGEPVAVTPGDETLQALGARRTPGEPVPEEWSRRIMSPPPRRRFTGPRRPGGAGRTGRPGRPERSSGRPRA